MSINWTPSGITIIATTSGSYTFTQNKSGVVRLYNSGANVGFAAISGKSAPVMPEQELFVSHGFDEDSVDTIDAEFKITPGFVSKRNIFGVSDLDIIRANPYIWYDPSDLSTLFKDSLMAERVTKDRDPVGAVLDKSGYGINLIQPILQSRPIYRTDGNISWIEFNGVDQYLFTTVPAIQSPYTCVSGFRLLSTIGPSTENMFFGATNIYLFQTDSGSHFQQGHAGGSLTNATQVAIGADFVATQYYSDGSENSRLAIDNEPYSEGTMNIAAPITLSDLLSIGNREANPGNVTNCRFSGLILVDSELSDSGVDTAQKYIARKQGRVNVN